MIYLSVMRIVRFDSLNEILHRSKKRKNSNYWNWFLEKYWWAGKDENNFFRLSRWGIALWVLSEKRFLWKCFVLRWSVCVFFVSFGFLIKNNDDERKASDLGNIIKIILARKIVG